MTEKDGRIEDVSIPSRDTPAQTGHLAGGEGLGPIHCDKSVFRKIAARAASCVDGVASIAGRSAIGDFFLGREKEAAIEVETAPESIAVRINLTITVFFDHNIYEVCTELQRRIKNDIETITNYTVESVGVKVEDMVASPPPPPGEEARPEEPRR